MPLVRNVRRGPKCPKILYHIQKRSLELGTRSLIHVRRKQKKRKEAREREFKRCPFVCLFACFSFTSCFIFVQMNRSLVQPFCFLFSLNLFVNPPRLTTILLELNEIKARQIASEISTTPRPKKHESGRPNVKLGPTDQSVKQVAASQPTYPILSFPILS